MAGAEAKAEANADAGVHELLVEFQHIFLAFFEGLKRLEGCFESLY